LEDALKEKDDYEDAVMTEVPMMRREHSRFWGLSADSELEEIKNQGMARCDTL
jgi:hypothetical protein